MAESKPSASKPVKSALPKNPKVPPNRPPKVMDRSASQDK